MSNKKIYYITESNIDFEHIKNLCMNGIDMIQYRNKDKSTRDMINEARQIKTLTDAYDTTFIINDRVDVAMAIDADGVHLGREDMSVEDAKKMIGDKIIGATAKTVEEAVEKMMAGANYLGCGAMYVSETKPTALPMSVETLFAIREATDLPVYIIGGITAENLTEELISMSDGICCSQYLSGSKGIKNLKVLEEKVL